MDERTPLDQDNQLLYAFLNRKKTRDNQVAMTAQRLVNLFRQLSSFDPEFVTQYNQMLLGANDEIQMMLQDIVGGPTVRQYLTYIKQAYGQAINDQEGAEKSSMPSVNTGYLPSPDDDTPFYKTALGFGEAAPKPSGESIVTVQDFTKWQKSQEALIRKVMMAQNKAISKLALALSEKKNNITDTTPPPFQNAAPNMAFTSQQPLNVNQPSENNAQSDLTPFEASSDLTQNNLYSSDNNQPVLSENTLSTQAVESAESFESVMEAPAEITDNSFVLPEETVESAESFESAMEEPAEITDNSFALPEETVEPAESFESAMEAPAEITDNSFALPEETVEPAESFESAMEAPAEITDNSFALPEETVEFAESFESAMEAPAEITDNSFAPPEETVEFAESFESAMEAPAEITDNSFALPEETVEPTESFESAMEAPEIIPELSFDAPNFSTTNTINENQNEPAASQLEPATSPLEPAASPLKEAPLQSTPQPVMPAPNQPGQPENHLKPTMPSISAFKNLSAKAPIPSALGNLFKFPKMPSFKSMPSLKPVGMPQQSSNQSPLPNKTGQSNEYQSEMKNQGGS